MKTKPKIQIDEQYDSLVPDNPQVMAELGINNAVTLWRYDHDPDLKFPPKIKIKQRNFRSRKALEEFKARMMSAGIVSRNKGAEALAKKRAQVKAFGKKRAEEAAAKKTAKTTADRRALEP